MARITALLPLILVAALLTASPVQAAPPCQAIATAKPRRALPVRSEEARTALALARARAREGRVALELYSGRCYAFAVYRSGHLSERLALVYPPGRIIEDWRGYAARSPLARGDEQDYGAPFAAPWAGPLLTLLFLLAFAERRVLRSRANFQLLALLSPGAGYLAWASGSARLSVWLYFAALLLLCSASIDLARRGPALTLQVSERVALALGALALGWRWGLNLALSKALDVGVFSVAGADQLGQGRSPWGALPDGGDTYGPFNYLFYLPFERVWPYTGIPTTAPAAHFVALACDALVIAALLKLGRRHAGGRAALALPLGWVLSPWSTFALFANTNDALLAAALAWALALWHRPLVRGLLLAAGGAAKLASLALLPLALRPRPGRVLLGALVALMLAALVAALVGAKPSTLWQSTVGYQSQRSAFFSIWWGQPLLLSLAKPAAVALILAIAWHVRGERRLERLAAWAMLSLIALQLSANYWFPAYLAWILPLWLFAGLAGRCEPVAHEQVPDEKPDPRLRRSTLLLPVCALVGLALLALLVADASYPYQGHLVPELVFFALAAATLALVRSAASTGAAMLCLATAAASFAFALAYQLHGLQLISAICDPCIPSPAEGARNHTVAYLVLNTVALAGLGLRYLREFSVPRPGIEK